MDKTNRIAKLVATVTDDVTLATHLGCSTRTLWHVAMKRHQMYEEFIVMMRPDRVRRAFAPNGLLRAFQRRLRVKILAPLSRNLGPHVTGGQVGKSTLDAARLHLRTCEVCDATSRPNTNPVKHECPRAGVKFRLELRDFSLSTRRRWIRRYFQDAVGFNEVVSGLLGQLLTTTYRDNARRDRVGVPPGALTSGDICNLVADWRLDGPLLATLPGWRYTRHNDSLYFSRDTELPSQEVSEVVQLVGEVIQASGYRVNWKALQVQHSRQPQRVLGIGINRKLNIPANEYRYLHHLLYHAKKRGFDAQVRWTKQSSVAELHRWIVGRLNHYSRVAPEKTAKLRKLYEEAKTAEVASEATQVPVLVDQVHERGLDWPVKTIVR
jgi:hypothetical protein